MPGEIEIVQKQKTEPYGVRKMDRLTACRVVDIDVRNIDPTYRPGIEKVLQVGDIVFVIFDPNHHLPVVINATKTLAVSYKLHDAIKVLRAFDVERIVLTADPNEKPEVA